tara:strand:+ start:30984 stop:31814 length:831 start_codon:yes stop_codon:yes gene_type:complete
MAGESSASGADQNSYNKNVRPAALAERHKQTIAEIEKLQEVERFLFQNLQSISNNQPDAAAQRAEIRKKIEKLVEFRRELMNKMKGMYTAAQTEVSQRRYDLADQIAVGKTMQDELTNTQAQLDALEQEKRNKIRLVKVGEYEYARYSEFRGIIKVIVYGCFIALLISFLMKQPWFPATLGVAGLGITTAWVVITIISRMFDNFRRDSQDYARFVQTDGQHYKNEIAEGSKGPGQGSGLAAMLGLGCPNPNYNKDAFTMMGIRPHESKKENFSYLQ